MASNVWKQKPSLDPAKWNVTKLGGGKGWTATRKAGAPAAPPKPKLPTGTTMPLNELPSNFVNRSGVVGGWKEIPVTMNPSDWEFSQNRAGRYFARPVDEFTGLDEGTRRQVGQFDADTAANRTYLQSRVEAAGANANADAEAAARRMASLGNLASTGVGDPEIAAAQARMLGTQASLANADQNRTVGLARDAAETRLANYDVARRAQRSAGLADARNAVQQAAVEQAKFQYQQEKDAKDLAARLRGQSLGLLSDKLQIEGQNQRAQLSADTDIATTNATLRTKLEIEAAKLQLQAQKLADKGQTAAADKKKKVAAAKLRESNTARRQAGTQIEKMMRGITIKQADGSEALVQYTPAEISGIIQRRFPALSKAVVNQLVNQYTGSSVPDGYTYIPGLSGQVAGRTSGSLYGG